MKTTRLALLTGRVFMCLGISPDEDYDCMRDFFDVGDLYYEVKNDIDGVNLTSNNDLLIEGKDNLALYVNKEDFALMLDLSEFTTNTIERLKNQG